MFTRSADPQRRPYRFDSSSETLEYESLVKQPGIESTHSPQRWTTTLLHCVLVAISSSALTAALMKTTQCGPASTFHLDTSVGSVSDADLQVYKNPPFNDLDRSYHIRYTKPFNYSGDAFTEDPSLGRVDDLWIDKMGVDDDLLLMSETHAAPFGLNRQNHVYHVGGKNTEGGEGGYVFHTQAMHQMHCLNEIRKVMAHNWPFYKARGDAHAPDEITFVHADHCLEILRQRLECTAELAIYPYVYTDFARGFIARFDQPHQCRDFKALREFSRQHMVLGVEKENLRGKAPTGTIVYSKDSFQ